jgi:hypothetical protein
MAFSGVRSMWLVAWVTAAGCYSSHPRPGAEDAGAPGDGGVEPDSARPDAGPDPEDVPGLVLVADAPPPRVGRAFFDARRSELVVLGGTMADVWALELAGGRWRRVDAGVGGPLMSRTPLGMIDGLRDRLLVIDEAMAVHALDLTTGVWTVVAVAGEVPRLLDMRVDAIDVDRDRLVFAGGGEAPALHALAIGDDGALRWQSVSPPLTREGDFAYFISHGLVIDRRRDRAILFGSHGAVGAHGTWAYPLAGGSWSPIAAATPTTFGQMTRWYDDEADRVVASGRRGFEELALGEEPLGWRRTSLHGDGSADAAVGDGRVYLFGGYATLEGRGEVTNAVRSIALGELLVVLDPVRAEEQRFASTTGDDLGWDGTRERLVRVTANTPYNPVSTEARSLAPDGRWRTVLDESHTPERIWSPLVSGPRVLRFGGHKYLEADGLYELGEREWSLRFPGGPDARALHGVAFDEATSTFFVGFGGSRLSYDGTIVYDDLWSIAIDAAAPEWRRISDGGGPGPRTRATLGFGDGRVLLFGGVRDDVPRSDVWAFSTADRAWRRLETESLSIDPPLSAAFSPDGRQVLAIGGRESRLVLFVGTIEGDRVRWRELCAGFSARAADLEPMLIAWTSAGPHLVPRDSGALLRVELDAPSCD